MVAHLSPRTHRLCGLAPAWMLLCATVAPAADGPGAVVDPTTPPASIRRLEPAATLGTPTRAGSPANPTAAGGSPPSAAGPGSGPNGTTVAAEAPARAANAARLQMIVRGPGEQRRARIGERSVRVGETLVWKGSEMRVAAITDHGVVLTSDEQRETIDLLPPLQPAARPTQRVQP
jgi:hypothetical protein